MNDTIKFVRDNYRRIILFQLTNQQIEDTIKATSINAFKLAVRACHRKNNYNHGFFKKMLVWHHKVLKLKELPIIGKYDCDICGQVTFHSILKHNYLISKRRWEREIRSTQVSN